MVLQTYKKGLYIMIDISNVPVVRVNEIQLATYKALARNAENGVVKSEVVALYKGNVINALINAGAVKTHFNVHLKLLDVQVELLVRKPNVRTLRKLGLVEQEEEELVAA
jgi:hypothetical protein